MKTRQRGFTLLELLIVVGILGLLAAIIVPNTARFFGRGEDESRKAEKHSVQVGVYNLMVENELRHIPCPKCAADGVAYNDMALFPDSHSDATDGPDADSLPDKAFDILGSTPWTSMAIRCFSMTCWPTTSPPPGSRIPPARAYPVSA